MRWLWYLLGMLSKRNNLVGWLETIDIRPPRPMLIIHLRLLDTITLFIAVSGLELWC